MPGRTRQARGRCLAEPPALAESASASAYRAGPPPGSLGGAEGNERLTVMTGAVLLILLAAEGFTILRLGRLLTLHFFIGMLLLGPVALKAGSVTYRFYRYYTGNVPYRRKGPPAPLLRLLGPCLMLLTAGVFGSGIMLAVIGPSGRHPWLLLHKASFILWFGAMAIHVLAYLPRLPRLLYAEARGVELTPDDGRGYLRRPAGHPGGAAARRPRRPLVAADRFPRRRPGDRPADRPPGGRLEVSAEILLQSLTAPAGA